MTQLIVWLPNRSDGEPIDVSGYGLFHNKTRHQIDDVYDDEGAVVREIVVGEKFEGAAWTAPPVQVSEPPPPSDDNDDNDDSTQSEGSD